LDVLFVQVLIVYSFSYTLFFNKRTHEGGDMAEPASSVVAIAAATITLSGSVIGLQYDALLAGFFGGLLSLLYLPPMPALKIAGAVAGSALLAGFFAPVIATAAQHYFPWLQPLGDFLRLAGGAALGLGGQVLIPAGLRRLRSLVRSA
jgi:ABC-type multidrug transport system permease subunit